jgi:signal recognition particle subunit SRP54
MFDALSERLGAALGDLRKRGTLDEEAISTAMREIRLALLEADVNLQVVRDFVARAREDGVDAVIVDTAGRLQIDEALMEELEHVRDAAKPTNVVLVLDSMTGQEAVNVAVAFEERIDFDGVILTKLDGDARGGAALSVKAVTGKPILFASTGEKLEQLERFHPDRMAQRILGMGDVLSLIEKAEQDIDASEAEELERKMRQDQFTLDDFLKQLKQVRRMGPLTSVLGMMPGMGKAMKELRGANVDDRELDRLEAMILSMTPEERADPDVIRGSRRRRIAAGSGTNVQAVKQLTKQFEQMRKMMKMMASGKMPSPEAMLRGQLGGRRR